VEDDDWRHHGWPLVVLSFSASFNSVVSKTLNYVAMSKTSFCNKLNPSG
jgi:hypothetical protein